MCQYCRAYPHLPGCPNAHEPEPAGTCEWCKEDIITGESYTEINGKMYHADCIGYMGSDELSKLFEFKIVEAR